MPLQCDGHSLTPFLQGATPHVWREAASWEFDWRSALIPHVNNQWPWDDRLTTSHLAVHRTQDTAYVQFGDGLITDVPRIKEVILPDFYKRNQYVWEHTYPGPGTYQIVVEDPNRNEGVKNIPNSVNTVFSIKTISVQPSLVR